MGEKGFRADQIYGWLHKNAVKSYDEMTNIPGALREKLLAIYPIYGVFCVQELVSREDGTRKFLYELFDGNVIESVFMRYKHGNSVCISSQVGCNMGCSFCASTLEGCVRDLSASEMLSQVYEAEKLTGERVSNVVVMGSGEPLDNYDELLRFIHILTSKEGHDLSGRNITVSTCGIVPKIRELADEKLQITLAISLHAATDEKRRELMPVAKAYSLDELLDACRYYFDRTGRRVSFEYSLVKGSNDSPRDAALLADLLSGMNAHVNLISVNPVKETGCRRPDMKSVYAFEEALKKRHINATVRRELGSDISAACGQLRRSYRGGGAAAN